MPGLAIITSFPFDFHFDRCGIDDKNKCRMGSIVWSFCIACGGCPVLFGVESIDRLIFVSIIFDIGIPLSSSFGFYFICVIREHSVEIWFRLHLIY